ncbi:MAG: methyl-accepting chemotaxis protein, partial [Methanomicrobiales archaeon HGW-Methanomicrobiales-4]
DGINSMLDAYIGPINVSAEYIDRISKGDIPPKITDDYHGDFNEIKNNLNALMDVVHMRNTDIQNLIQAAIEGKLDVRADSSTYPGENGKMIDGINSMLDAYIGPINVAAEYIDRISKGDLPPVITDDYHGDFNEIKNNLNSCISTLSYFVRSMDHMYQDQKAGEIDSFLNEGEFIGIYQDMARGVNEDVKLHVNNILKILGIIVSYAEGDFSPVLEKLPGKQIIANENMDLLRSNLIQLTDDVGMLGKGASDGHLDIRADLSRYHGGFLKIAEGFNMTLDAVINPLNLSAEYIDRISKGDIPPKITDDYHGDFNEIKNNLNALIDVVHMRNADIKMLIQAAVDGKLDVRADSSKYPGENGKMLDGINHMLDAYIGPLNLAAEYIDRISKGDLPPKITDDYKGDFNEIKNNLNQCIGAIHLLIDDVNLLSDAAVKGDLDARADPNRHMGDYSRVVTGVNQTLDAVVAPLREAMRVS